MFHIIFTLKFLELLSQMPEDNPIVEMKVKEWLNFQKNNSISNLFADKKYFAIKEAI